MKIKFDKQSGEILDLLWSLYYISNYDYIMSEIKKNNIEIDENIEKASQYLMNIKEIDKSKVNLFFNRETMIFDALLQDSEVFGRTLEDCLIEIEQRTEKEVINRLIKELLRDKISDEEQRTRASEKIVKNNSLFDFIKELDISDGGKWNLICFVRDVKSYTQEATALIRNYAPYFYNELEKHRDRIEKFQEKVQKRIEENSMEFIKQLFKSDLKSEDYNEINITVTYLHYYSLYLYTMSKIGYIVLGANYESIISKLEGTSEIDKCISVLKNLSDRTRFEIIKLLLKKDYFGQELAYELNITTATVSYHMNQLFASNLVQIERMEHKAFYKLNKEIINKTLEFLACELEL